MRRTVALFHSKRVAASIFAVTIALLPACGSQLVEFPDTDGGKADTGKADRAVVDGVGSDAKIVDSANVDLATIEVLSVDVGIRDAGIADTGADNAQIRDGSLPDALAGDARTMDLRILVDVGLTDTAGDNMQNRDASFADAPVGDARSADLRNVDANFPDVNSDVESLACRQLPVFLGAAGNFVVLAGATATNTGLTSVTGDLGVSPGTAVTGFPPGAIVGAQHAGDPTAAQGIADLTTAYNDAAGRVLCAITVAGNLGGQTLTPGLYHSNSSLAISSGDLTLDAQGDASAVFIFQMASTLTTTSARQIILSGGAKSTNVFWQVGTSATLGTMSVFQGTIMADQAITLNTGATLNGRALARIAGVSLDANSIVKPTP